MAKIGTAQIEIKPVINDEALDVIVERIAEAVAEGVRRGMAEANAKPHPVPLKVWRNGVQVSGNNTNT